MNRDAHRVRFQGRETGDDICHGGARRGCQFQFELPRGRVDRLPIGRTRLQGEVVAKFLQRRRAGRGLLLREDGVIVERGTVLGTGEQRGVKKLRRLAGVAALHLHQTESVQRLGITRTQLERGGETFLGIWLAGAKLRGAELVQCGRGVGEHGETLQLINRRREIILFEQHAAKVEMRDVDDVAAVEGQRLLVGNDRRLRLASGVIRETQMVPCARILRHQLGGGLQLFQRLGIFFSVQQPVPFEQRLRAGRSAAAKNKQGRSHRNGAETFWEKIFDGQHLGWW